MKHALSTMLLAVALLTASVAAGADGWTPDDLAGYSTTVSDERPSGSMSAPRATADQGPSLWEQIQLDMRRFNARTKRFFDETADALTWDSPPKFRSPLSGWFQPKPKPRRHETRSWFGGLFAPEEPRMPQSPQDFVGMDRPEM